MSRFDLDPEEVAKEAQELHDRTTRERASYGGGTPPPEATRPTAKKDARKPPTDVVPQEDPMKFHIRANLTFTENDPVGRALAERLRAMPEASRKHYSMSKAVREAIIKDLDGLAKRL